MYPLGYPSPFDSSKTINTIAEALDVAYGCKSYEDSEANDWTERGIGQRNASASRFPRFSSTAMDASVKKYTTILGGSPKFDKEIDEARDNDGVDFITVYQKQSSKTSS